METTNTPLPPPPPPHRECKFSFSENLMTVIESAAGGGRTSLVASASKHTLEYPRFEHQGVFSYLMPFCRLDAHFEHETTPR